MSKIDIQIVKNTQTFYNLRLEWSSLIKNSLTDSIFLTWEWVYSWWLAYSKDKQLYIITVRNGNNELIGIAPLFFRQAKYYKIPVLEFAFLGDKASDRHDFIVHTKYPQVYKVLIHHILNRKNWDIVRLEQVPEWSELATHEQFTKACVSEIASILPFVNIISHWETYFRGLSKKFRRDLKHKYNVLKREGEWKFNTSTNPINIEHELEKLIELEIASKKETKGYALFADSRARYFHKMFSIYCKDHDWLSISYITLNDNPISYLIGYKYNNKYLAYNMAYAPEYSHASPGKLLLHETIKLCFDKNLDEFDFLRGNTYIKQLWARKTRTNYRIVFFNRGVKAQLLKTAIFCIRPLIKEQLSQGYLKRLLGRKP